MRHLILLCFLAMLSACVSKPAQEYFGPELPKEKVAVVTVEDMDKFSDIVHIASYTEVDNQVSAPRRVNNKELHLLPGEYVFKVKCARFRVFGADLEGFPSTKLNVEAGKTYYLGCLSSLADDSLVSVQVKRVEITQ